METRRSRDESHDHWLINYIDTKAKCRQLKIWPANGLCGRCLSQFRDWRMRYKQSGLYFRPSFVNCCPSPLLSGSTLPLHLPCMKKYTVCTHKQCVRDEVGGYGVLGLRQINTSRKVPLQVTFCIAFYESYLSERHEDLVGICCKFLLATFKGSG